ncbi:hypothetical protein V6Z11_D04G155300 [Gossypium hirsutum]|uniref:Retrovirus-related Pol polyprotein from transposon TNT 1-94 n=1 Tax=Gossypium hirsutum TaxID=3635 RepID=A0A1U8IM10_GOSHI|nr:uncharacterized protein LOC107898129 [Gossypium hirsutum]
MTVSNKMWSNRENTSNSKIVEKILRTLTEKFTYVVVSINESNNIDNMFVDELQSSLVVHEQKFRKVCSEDEDQVLKEANYEEVEEKDEDVLLLIAYEEPHEDERSDMWFLDSGCSNHM